MLKSDASQLCHTAIFFSEISAIFQGDTINNIAGLLELTIQTKLFSSSDANRSK